ncbi:glycosyltransferase family 2 protein [Candidatus Gracilibacteria bacterium]|nr:glycosyltransferase family 2 protein [Candidatus Gracilibacteria bacterium]
MKFSVIIPTFNRAEILRRNLNLLATQTFDDFEVVVIDDGSTDETLRLLREFEKKVEFPLRFLTQKNSGQGVARNQGIKISAGEILLFLGDDMLPLPNLLEKHAEFHDSHPADNFACFGLVRWHPEIRISKFMKWLERSGVQFKFQDLKENSETDFWRFYTANISLKKSFLGKERFNENFSGWGFEDAEIGLRLQKKGMKLLFSPEAIAQHFHKISAGSLADRQLAAGRNAVKFQKLHPEISILPRGGKLLAQKIIASLLPFTFYGKAKRAFLRGIAEANREG